MGLVLKYIDSLVDCRKTDWEDQKGNIERRESE